MRSLQTHGFPRDGGVWFRTDEQPAQQKTHPLDRSTRTRFFFLPPPCSIKDINKENKSTLLCRQKSPKHQHFAQRLNLSARVLLLRQVKHLR